MAEQRRSHPSAPLYYPVNAASNQAEQYAGSLDLLFTQLTDQIADSQVPESAVTQHEAALSIDWDQLFNTPTTRDEYGLTDVYTMAEADAAFLTAAEADALFLTPAEGNALYSLLGHTHTFASLTSKPSTIGGFGITDFNSLGDARWSLLAHTHTFASLTSKPTTLAGFGITDAVDGVGTAGKHAKWSDSNTLTDSILAESGTGITMAGAASAPFLTLDANAGVVRDLRFSTAGVNRWLFRADLTAEAGANAGSDFVINRRDDAGGDLGDAFKITRSTGNVTLQAQAIFSTSGPPLRFNAATVANAAVAVTLGSTGPTGSTAGAPRGWLPISVAGTTRYIPFW